MKLVKFVPSTEGIRQLLNLPAVGTMCFDQARQVAARAGPGYEATQWTGTEATWGKPYPDTPLPRTIASVETATFRARRDNSRNQTLLRALGGGIA